MSFELIYYYFEKHFLYLVIIQESLLNFIILIIDVELVIKLKRKML
jgi:hypothetical protein